MPEQPKQKRAFSFALTSYLVPGERELPEPQIQLDLGSGNAAVTPVEFTVDNKADFLTGVTQIGNDLWEALSKSNMV